MNDSERGQTHPSSTMGGWKQVEGEPAGTFTTEKQPQDFTTSDFSKHAEASRARWDLIEFLKVKFQQLLRR
jgi:hypothetical protein